MSKDMAGFLFFRHGPVRRSHAGEDGLTRTDMNKKATDAALR